MPFTMEKTAVFPPMPSARVSTAVTVPVKTCVDPSEKVPVALNCPVTPRARSGLPGETEIDEAFFPVLWQRDGYRSPWLDDYLAAPSSWSA